MQIVTKKTLLDCTVLNYNFAVNHGQSLQDKFCNSSKSDEQMLGGVGL